MDSKIEIKNRCIVCTHTLKPYVIDRKLVNIHGQLMCRMHLNIYNLIGPTEFEKRYFQKTKK